VLSLKTPGGLNHCDRRPIGRIDNRPAHGFRLPWPNATQTPPGLPREQLEGPPETAEAARRFAATETASGNALQQNWLNNGPETLARSLLPGGHERLSTVFECDAITLRCLGRPDLLKSKLFAVCD